MADTKISELTSITGANVNDTADELAIVDDSATQTKKITRAELFQDVLKIKVGSGADGAGNADELVASKDQTNVGISILTEDSTGYCRLLFGSQTNNNAAKVQHNENNDQLTVQAAGELRLQTGGTNDRVTVDSSGNVGINTTSPSAVLDVVGQSGAGAATIDAGDYGLEIGTYNSATQTDLVFTSNAVVGSQTSLSFVAETGGYHRFMTGGTSHKTGTSGASEAMRIDSSGNVGIGTIPATKLHVQDADNTLGTKTGTLFVEDTEASVEINSAAGGDCYVYFTDGNTNATSGGSIKYAEPGGAGQHMALSVGGSEAMRLDASGNVGINTTSPSENLHVVSAGSTTMRLEATNTSTAPGIDFYGKDAGGTTYQAGIINSTGGSGSLEFSADPTNAEANTRITFETDGTERARINDTGLGIGNSTPSQALDVTGNAAVSGKAKIGGGADGASNSDELVISKDQTNVGMSILAADATGLCRILFGSQTSTNAAKIQHSESNSRLFVQAEGDIYFQTGGTNTKMTLNTDGDLDVTGALSKGSGSFKIDHPLKPDTHHLVHSFIEGPQADNIYRGTVALVGGAATVNLDTAGRMSEGTFVALNGNVQCFTSNEQGWTAVRGSVSGNTLTIEAQDATCTDTVSWMVVGERHDQHMIDTAWTDAQGRVITEPEKVEDTQEEAE